MGGQHRLQHMPACAYMQAASAFGALVPQNASVAEQPVYSERDGTAIATVSTCSRVGADFMQYRCHAWALRELLQGYDTRHEQLQQGGRIVLACEEESSMLTSY